MEDGLTICVVGLGLMGGSLALALRSRDAGIFETRGDTETRTSSRDTGTVSASPRLPVSESVSAQVMEGTAKPRLQSSFRIAAVARRLETLEAAWAAGAIDVGTTDLAEGVSGADIVVLATPVRTILRLLPEVGVHARQGTLVLDLGSTKAQICAAMADLPPGLQPVGGHPMCGKEMAGFAAADASLFHGRPFVLCPLARTALDALDLALGIVGAAGAHPVLMSPAEHDRAVAAVSHLPYVVAASLVNAVTPAGRPAHSLAASGFRDTSRLASSNVEMMADILLTNRAAILAQMDAFADRLAELRSALAAGDENGLTALLAAAQEQRRRIGGSAGW